LAPAAVAAMPELSERSRRVHAQLQDLDVLGLPPDDVQRFLEEVLLAEKWTEKEVYPSVTRRLRDQQDVLMRWKKDGISKDPKAASKAPTGPTDEPPAKKMRINKDPPTPVKTVRASSSTHANSRAETKREMTYAGKLAAPIVPAPTPIKSLDRLEAAADAVAGQFPERRSEAAILAGLVCGYWEPERPAEIPAVTYAVGAAGQGQMEVVQAALKAGGAEAVSVRVPAPTPERACKRLLTALAGRLRERGGIVPDWVDLNTRHLDVFCRSYVVLCNELHEVTQRPVVVVIKQGQLVLNNLANLGWVEFLHKARTNDELSAGCGVVFEITSLAGGGDGMLLREVATRVDVAMQLRALVPNVCVRFLAYGEEEIKAILTRRHFPALSEHGVTVDSFQSFLSIFLTLWLDRLCCDFPTLAEHFNLHLRRWTGKVQKVVVPLLAADAGTYALYDGTELEVDRECDSVDEVAEAMTQAPEYADMPFTIAVNKDQLVVESRYRGPAQPVRLECQAGVFHFRTTRAGEVKGSGVQKYCVQVLKVTDELLESGGKWRLFSAPMATGLELNDQTKLKRDLSSKLPKDYKHGCTYSVSEGSISQLPGEATRNRAVRAAEVWLTFPGRPVSRSPVKLVSEENPAVVYTADTPLIPVPQAKMLFDDMGEAINNPSTFQSDLFVHNAETDAPTLGQTSQKLLVAAFVASRNQPETDAERFAIRRTKTKKNLQRPSLETVLSAVPHAVSQERLLGICNYGHGLKLEHDAETMQDIRRLVDQGYLTMHGTLPNLSFHCLAGKELVEKLCKKTGMGELKDLLFAS